jgi:F-type H+-transporting ATPase subunit b
MDLNLTLIGQMITFAIFVWVTMKFVWPPLMAIMEQRRQQIADGLAAAEQGQRELELAHVKHAELVDDAKVQASSIIDEATKRGHHLVEEAKLKAREEGARIVKLAEAEAQQQFVQLKAELLQQIAGLAIQGAEKILKREVDVASNEALVNEMVGEI